ncbi:MAG: hypothetical protein ACE1ZI_06850, partial [Acidobacteriota bacterium]
EDELFIIIGSNDMLPRSDYYRMPANPWISFKYCDLTKLIKLRLSPSIRRRYKNFDGAITLGEMAPEIDLKGDNGERFRLSDRIGKKNVVLVFGAIT